MNTFKIAIFSFGICFSSLQYCQRELHATIVFDNINADYGQGTFEQYTAGQQVGASIVNGPLTIVLDTVSMGGTLPSVLGEFLAIYSRVSDGSFLDGTLDSLLYQSSAAPDYVENKPVDAFNPARGTTTFHVNGAFALQSNTGYWFVLGSPNPDPSTGPIQWAYTYDTSFASDVDANYPIPGDLVTYFSGTVPDPDPSDLSYYFSLADGPQLLQVTGSPVPEPASSVLFLMGSIGTLTLRGRNLTKLLPIVAE